MGFFQFGSLFIFVGQKLTKMTKADIVKQLAQETGVVVLLLVIFVSFCPTKIRQTSELKKSPSTNPMIIPTGFIVLPQNSGRA